MTSGASVDLSLTSNRDYTPGRSLPVRGLWLFVEALFISNPVVTSYGFKRFVLRRFGARVGDNVILKPGIHVKYPWRLKIGNNSWLGERCWIDNMEDVSIGANAVISQGAYLCTGNHNWADPGMGLTPQPIIVEDGAWIGAFARIAPGRTVAAESVLALGAVLFCDTEPRSVYAGNPAEFTRRRFIRDEPGPAREAGGEPS